MRIIAKVGGAGDERGTPTRLCLLENSKKGGANDGGDGKNDFYGRKVSLAFGPKRAIHLADQKRGHSHQDGRVVLKRGGITTEWGRLPVRRAGSSV